MKTSVALHLRALAESWLAATQDRAGQRHHWRGQDYMDGQDDRAEACADELLSLLLDAYNAGQIEGD
jgi:hypothetical protein